MITSYAVRKSSERIYQCVEGAGKTCFQVEELVARCIADCIAAIPQLGVFFPEAEDNIVTNMDSIPYNWRPWQKFFHLGMVRSRGVPLIPEKLRYGQEGSQEALADMFISLAVALMASSKTKNIPFSISNTIDPKIRYDLYKYGQYIRYAYGNFLWWVDTTSIHLSPSILSFQDEIAFVKGVVSRNPSTNYLFTMANVEVSRDFTFDRWAPFSFVGGTKKVNHSIAQAMSDLVNLAMYFGINLPFVAEMRAEEMYNGA